LFTVREERENSKRALGTENGEYYEIHVGEGRFYGHEKKRAFRRVFSLEAGGLGEGHHDGMGRCRHGPLAPPLVSVRKERMSCSEPAERKDNYEHGSGSPSTKRLNKKTGRNSSIGTARLQKDGWRKDREEENA